MNDAPLATQIKETRARLGLSQSQAAAAWAVPVKTLQKWEQGLREPQGLALDALRQKLAAAVVGDVPAAGQPQDEQSEAVPAPEAKAADVALDEPSEADKYLAFLAAQTTPEPQAQGDDATLDTPAQARPTPPDSAPVPIPSDPLPVATPTPAAAVRVGIEWLPFVSVAHSYARYRERMRSSPPVTGDVGW